MGKDFSFQAMADIAAVRPLHQHFRHYLVSPNRIGERDRNAITDPISENNGTAAP